jgi:hypothetical protein
MSGPGPQGQPGGEAARAQIVSIQGDRRGGELTIQLQLQRPGQGPVEVWCRQQVPASYAAALQEGQTVAVVVDPRDPRWAWLDLQGSGDEQRSASYQDQLEAYKAANTQVPERQYVPPGQQLPPGYRPPGQGYPGQGYPGQGGAPYSGPLPQGAQVPLSGYPGGMPGGWNGDPRLVPVEGVTYEMFVQLSAEQLAHPMPPQQFDQLTYSRGVAPGRWPAIQGQWNQRFGQFPDLGMRFQQDVTQAVGRMTGAQGAPPPTMPQVPWGPGPGPGPGQGGWRP